MAAKALLVAVTIIGMVTVTAVPMDTGFGGQNSWEMHSEQEWPSDATGLHARQERAASMLIPVVKSAFKLLQDDLCLDIDCSADKEVCSMSGCGGCVSDACTAAPK